MAETRRATVADAEAIAEMRRQMFADAGLADEAAMAPMVANFVPWVRAKLEEDSYVG
jgi:hypothetical protein